MGWRDLVKQHRRLQVVERAARAHRGTLAPRALLALLTPSLLPLVAFIAVRAEASVPRAAAPLREPIAFVSLGERELAGASREVASLRSPTPSLAEPAAAESDFALFAGDEIARALDPQGQGAYARPFGLGLGLGLGAEDLGGEDPLRGLAFGAPETRIGGAGLFLGSRIGERERLSLDLQWACSVSRCELADGKPLDPWELATDLDPRSNPDVAAALAEAQARAASAPVNHDWSIGPMSPPSPTAGAFWYGFDALTLGNFSAEGNRYGFLASSRSHAADDLVAFKRTNPKVVLGLDAAAALAGPGKFLKAVGLVGALGSYAENTEAPEAAAPVAVAATYRGGPHSDTRMPTGDEMDSHHMPPRSVSPLDPKKGPAIKMDPPDHQLTSSFGGTREAQEYRAELKAMLAEGRWREVMAREIRDVRRVAGKK